MGYALYAHSEYNHGVCTVCSHCVQSQSGVEGITYICALVNQAFLSLTRTSNLNNIDCNIDHNIVITLM